jgi:hypothetical protein
MKIRDVMAGAALAAVLATGQAGAQAASGPLPMETAVRFGAIDAMCSGVGSEKDDARSQGYPVRVEFSNQGGQFLSGEQVTLSGASGNQLAQFQCNGSWVLLRLPHGLYTIHATIPGSGTRSAKFEPPQTGQKRVEMQYTNVPPDK